MTSQVADQWLRVPEAQRKKKKSARAPYVVIPSVDPLGNRAGFVCGGDLQDDEDEDEDGDEDGEGSRMRKKKAASSRNRKGCDEDDSWWTRRAKKEKRKKGVRKGSWRERISAAFCVPCSL